MREPEERDLEAAFAALPAALRADDSGSLHTAVLSAAYQVEESDPELGVDSLTDWFWNEMIERLTSPSTLTLGWTGGMIGGGSVSLWLLPATATSVWTIEIDGAAETYQPLAEYGSVEEAESAAASESLSMFSRYGLADRIDPGPFDRSEIRSKLMSALEKGWEPFTWDLLAMKVEELSVQSLGSEANTERDQLLDRYLDLAVQSPRR
jgi:hypothetical protein